MAGSSKKLLNTLDAVNYFNLDAECSEPFVHAQLMGLRLDAWGFELNHQQLTCQYDQAIRGAASVNPLLLEAEATETLDAIYKKCFDKIFTHS
jgi:hypothetical protein